MADAAATMPERVLQPVFLPAGVADPAGETGYAADPPGVVAFALRDGRTLWRSDAAVKPALSDGPRLVAIRVRPHEALEVVVLDATRQGEIVVASDPVPLPSWAAEPSRIHVHGAGARLHLEWEAHTRYAGGAPPPAHVLREAARDAAGAAEVDLDSGAVTRLPADLPAVRRPPLGPDDVEEPWLAGGTVVRLAWDVGAGEQTLELERGEPHAPMTLARGSGLVAQPTADGSHVLVHAEPPGERDTWAVFDVPSGRRVATVTHDRGARAPSIVGGRVFYLVESPGARALRARELETDTLVWELPMTAPPMSGAPRPRP